MLKTRLIPCLLINNETLVKTTNYTRATYLGDPVNTCRIFNELEVDEVCLLDIGATREKKEPNYKLLSEIANECFMPLGYGGGVTTLAQAEKIFSIGYEKIIVNSATFTAPEEMKKIIAKFGSQAVVASVDIKKNFFGKYEVFTHSGSVKQKVNPVEWVMELEKMGFGEILLNNIDREGTWNGFDLKLIKSLTEVTSLPLIAHGGAGSTADIVAAVKEADASAVGLGNMVVYQKKGMGVLINFPDKEIRKRLE